MTDKQTNQRTNGPKPLTSVLSVLLFFFNEFDGHYRRLSHGLLICLLEARLMLWGFMPLRRTMNPGVCTMSLFADYVKFCANVEGQGVTLTFDTHVASFTH